MAHPHLFDGTLPLSAISASRDTQARHNGDAMCVREYTEVLDDLPPVEVYWDGDVYWLADGHHRYQAHKDAGRQRIKVLIRDGSKRDAIYHATGANLKHGLRRTMADKRRAVWMLLADPEWGKMSDRAIAEHCGVSHPFVAKLRESEADSYVRSGEKERRKPRAGTQPSMPEQQENPEREPQPLEAPPPDVIAELDAENLRLRALVQTLRVDDKDAELERMQAIVARAETALAEAMDAAHAATKREMWAMDQLRRIGALVRCKVAKEVLPAVRLALGKARANARA